MVMGQTAANWQRWCGRALPSWSAAARPARGVDPVIAIREE